METKTKIIADRNTIADFFKTDSLTTNRILQNLNWGFFQTHFESPQIEWDNAHPFLYPNHPSINYHEIDINFIKKHFELFSIKQFWTSAGWKFNSKKNITEWTYESGYKNETVNFLN